MLDLVYPVSPAPLIAGAVKVAASEMIPIVDVQGNVVSQAPRSFCHNGSKVLHPVVHLHLIDRMGHIYLQKRASTKDLLPLHWDTSVGGHVSYGEYIMEALAREVSEELGIMNFNPVFIESSIWESDIEREFVNSFAAVGNFTPVPDASEIAEGRWWSFSEIKKSKERFTPNFMSEFLRIKDTLVSLL